MKVAFKEHGAGKPVILLHAFPLSGRMWEPQVAELVAANCRVILPDFRGFGDNHNFADINMMEDLAKDISDLLDNLEIEKAVIGGLSMGGYVLFSLYCMIPQKFAAIVLADTNCGADAEEKRESRFDLIEEIETSGAAALTEKMLPNLISDFTKKNNPELVKKLEADFAAVKAQGAIAALRGMAARADNCDCLSSMDVPALLIFGAEDKITGIEIAEKMNSRIKDSRLVKIENAGHYSNLEQPETFNSALREFVDSIEM